MRITRWGEYGILCSLYLARDIQAHANGENAVGAAEIADSQHMPLQYAHQVLHRLRKGGIIKSIRGPRGGFILAQTPEMISLKDILCAAEGSTFDVVCEDDPLSTPCCESTGICALRTVWKDMRGVIDQYLSHITLSDLLKQEKDLGMRKEELVQI